jgi:hypothetical protein
MQTHGDQGDPMAIRRLLSVARVPEPDVVVKHEQRTQDAVRELYSSPKLGESMYVDKVSIQVYLSTTTIIRTIRTSVLGVKHIEIGSYIHSKTRVFLKCRFSNLKI